MTVSVIFGTKVGQGTRNNLLSRYIAERITMQLTMMGEYAIRTMLHLAALRTGTIAGLSDISKQWEIPENFLRKISAQLAGAGLVTSYRGLGGGVTLGRPAETITLLDIIETVEGRISLNKCLVHDGFCPRDSWCAVHLVWGEAQAKLKEVLAAKNLAQLAAQTAERKALVEHEAQCTAASNSQFIQ